MIEVEKKFTLNEGDETRLIRDAVFVSEKIMDDTYYDTADYALSKQDQWLRVRNGVPELKVSLHEDFGTGIQQYDELEEADIRTFLKMAGDGSFIEVLALNGYMPIAHYIVTRREYKKGDFILDFDDTDYGDSRQQILEIEVQVKNKSEMDTAADRIHVFAKEMKLDTTNIRGKLIEYFKRKKPELYDILKKAGVVKVV